MANQLRILFIGNDKNKEQVCRVIKNSGYDFLFDYVDESEDIVNLYDEYHSDLVIVLLPEDSTDFNDLSLKVSHIPVPWVCVFKTADRSELLRLLEVGCRDIISVDDLNRLEFILFRLQKEKEGEDRKQNLHKKLVAEKDMLDRTVNNMGDGVITVDCDGRIFMMNKSAEKITGWTSEIAMKTPFPQVFNIVEKTTGTRLHQLVSNAIINGETRGLKKNTVLISKDGEEKYVSASISPTAVFSGCMGAVIVFRDITRIIQAEEGLQRYRLLSDKASDIILFSSPEGKVLEVNAATLSAYGYTVEEILNKSISDLIIPDKQVPFITNENNTTDVYYEATACRKDGSTFFVEASQQGAIIGKNKVILSIQRDITERKQVRKELEKAREKAEAANIAKSEFLANMSHEIRTPLNGMLGMIDLTLLTGLTEEQKENLHIAKGCATTLLNLVNDILDFSRIEAKKLTLEKISFHFSELIEQTIKPHMIKARGKGLKFDCSVASVVYH